MNLILLNSQSNQQILLDRENPLIIGRNNVLGCFDKKVSRSHGRITCTENGNVNLLALHSNPCFFMKNGVPPVHQINKDEEEILNEGDCFGLLPNSFWFQVLSSNDVKIKKETEEVNDKLGRYSESHDSENVNNNEDITSEAQNAEFYRAEPSEYSKRLGSPEFEKTKRLPLWMYETDEIKESGTSVNTTESDVKTKKLKLDTGLKSNGSNKENNAGGGEPSTSRVSTDEINTETEEVTNSQEDKGSVTETESDKNNKRPICQYEHNCLRKNPQHKIEFCHPGDSDYVPYVKRPLCQYGEACYRRNEGHKVEFRHLPLSSPNSCFDSSSKPSSPIGEERPPCYSGSSCLNQNPQHRKDLYHPPKGYVCHFGFEDSSSSSSSWDDFEIYEDYLAKEYDSDFASSPLPFKRKRKKVKPSLEYEDEDDYDLEDPFINDASSDEYVPSDLNSEEDLDESQEIY